MFQEYLHAITRTLEKICTDQGPAMEQAAAFVGKTLSEDGLIYLFGCGHSHMLAEEGFYRAGGLGAVSAMLPAEFMLHEGAVKSSALERRADLAEDVMARYPLAPCDTLIVFSTSDINGMPVEMARLGKARGARVIAVSSSAYHSDCSRHPDGLKLHQVCDVWIDNCAPHGDAMLAVSGLEGKMGPVSTAAGAYILHCILARGAEICIESGSIPAHYISGNVEGGREKNQGIIQRYRHRIRAL